jgi:regulator of protease activity HflC (stomatin/prohibitin superfamily)
LGHGMLVAYRTVRVVTQARTAVVERLGRYQRTLPQRG